MANRTVERPPPPIDRHAMMQKGLGYSDGSFAIPLIAVVVCVAPLIWLALT